MIDMTKKNIPTNPQWNVIGKEYAWAGAPLLGTSEMPMTYGELPSTHDVGPARSRDYKKQ